MGTVAAAIIVLGVLGGVFGIGLAIVARRFSVHVDPRVEQIEEALAGANCGACGYAGCRQYAEAIAAGQVECGRCPLAGVEAVRAIARITGVEAEVKEKQVAVVHCQGRDVADRFRYDGIADCRAAALAQGGPKACAYGCLGFGTCAAVCPFDAITMVDGLPHVDEARCVGCGRCVEACPNHLIAIHPLSHYVHVLCRSRDKGGTVKRICDTGCIGCKKCEKACKFEAIHVEDFLAVIDYDKCTSCAACVKACPTGAIQNLRKQRRDLKKKAAAAA